MTGFAIQIRTGERLQIIPTISTSPLRHNRCDIEVTTAFPEEGIQFNNQGTMLFDRGFVYFYVCYPGEISLTTTGTTSLNTKPTLTVAWNARTLWSGEISKTETISLNIPAPGWITLSLSNRYYNPPEIQSLNLQDLRYKANIGGTLETQIINLSGE